MTKSGVTKLSEIAKLAGVSESTASRALSGNEMVAEATRKRVSEIARLCNYTVNRNARNLRLQQAKVVDVVAPVWQDRMRSMRDPFLLEMIGVIADCLSENGYEVLLSTKPPWAENWGHNSLTNGRADAIILIGQGTEKAKLAQFTGAHKNVVVWGAQVAGESYCTVGTDNIEGGRLATKHLLQTGRKRIAYFGEVTHPEGLQRLEGYKRALTESEIGYSEDLVFGAAWDSETARVTSDRLLASLAHKAGIDGVFVSGDALAMNVISNLSKAGVRVPDDVGIVGFDNISAAELFNPAITTVDQDIRLGGRLLAERALASIAGEDIASFQIPPRLIVRESSRPVTT